MRTSRLPAVALFVALVFAVFFAGAAAGYGFQDALLQRDIATLRQQQDEQIGQLIAEIEQLNQDLAEAKSYQGVLFGVLEDLVLLMEYMVDDLRAIVGGPYDRREALALIEAVAEVVREANKLLPERDVDDISRAIVEQSLAAGIDPWLVAAMAFRESTFRPGARGKAGEYGMLQIMPCTGRWIAGRLGHANWKPADMLDVQTNIRFSVFFLSAVTGDLAQLGRTDEERMWIGVLAYNAGPTGARNWLSSERRPQDHWYVKRVMTTYQQYRGDWDDLVRTMEGLNELWGTEAGGDPAVPYLQ